MQIQTASAKAERAPLVGEEKGQTKASKMRKVTALLIAAALSGCVATSSRWNAPPTRNNTVAKRVKISSDAACSSAADCSYNGECTSGSCVCKPAFKGGACEQFNFQPLDRSKGTGLRSIMNGEQVSSWGGSVLLADDGKYHMVGACAIARLEPFLISDVIPNLRLVGS